MNWDIDSTHIRSQEHKAVPHGLLGTCHNDISCALGSTYALLQYSHMQLD